MERVDQRPALRSRTIERLRIDRRLLDELGIDLERFARAVTIVYSSPVLHPMHSVELSTAAHEVLLIGRILSDVFIPRGDLFRRELSRIARRLIEEELGVPAVVPDSADPDTVLRSCIASVVDCYRTRCMDVRTLAEKLGAATLTEILDVEERATSRCLAIASRAVVITSENILGIVSRTLLTIRRRRAAETR